MHFLKTFALSFLTLLLLLSFNGCSGGEADYTLDEVESYLHVDDLINGEVSFLTPDNVVIDENSKKVTTLVADADENIQYSVVGGKDKDLFTIDERTGQLSFIKPQPYIEGGLNIYEVVIGVTTGSDTLSTMTMYISVVKDIKTVKPLIDHAATTVQTVVTAGVITKIEARPADETSTLTFSLIGDDAEAFEIDSDGNVRFTEPLPDYEATPDKVYDLSVVITDGYLNTVTTEPISISLVANPDLIRPVIETASVTVVENALGSEQIDVTVSGTGVLNSYTLGGSDAELFTVSETGVLSFVAARDFETPPNQFSITLQVGDDKGNKSDVKAITVTVIDIDEAFTFQTFSDFSPMEGVKEVGTVAATPNTLTHVTPLYKLVQGSTLLTIDETGKITFKNTAQKGQVITAQVSVESELNGSLTLSKLFTVTVVDDPAKQPPVINQTYATVNEVTAPIDTSAAIVSIQAALSGNATQLSYRTTGADAGKFTVDSSGNLYFAGNYDYYTPQDANSDNVYEVAVVVTDNNGNSVSTESITVTLLEDPNTMVPEITSSTFNVSENSTEPFFIQIATPGNGVADTYTVVAGGDGALFDFSDGILRFVSAPDFETPASTTSSNSYHVTLKVTDDLGNESAPKEIIVNVQDVDETLNFTSLASFTHVEGTQLVGTVTATSKVAMGAVITYSVTTGSALFSIDSTTGAFSFKSAPAYVASGNNTYTLKVTAQSQFNGSATTSDTITVTVMPASYAITFDSDQSTAYRDQNTVITFPMTAASAAGESLTYSLEEGYDASIFSINASTGYLTIDAPAYRFSTDTEANVYRAAVVASDTLGHSARRQGVLYINEVDGIPKFTSGTTRLVSENVKTLSSVSAYSPISSAITYSIDGGADAALFSISTTGALSFTYAPNFENPQDQNSDNVYEVTVRVTDTLYAVNTATQTILVTVTNVADAPSGIVFDATGTTSVSVSDGSHVFFIPTNKVSYRSLRATPSPSNGTLNYVLISNPDSDIFSMSSGGELKVDAPPFSSDQHYTLTVRVSEVNGESKDQTLSVTILD